jgi:nucleotide-binding universal stress UspA family protein
MLERQRQYDMVYLVPFDGSPLSRSALRRAVTFSDEQEVVTLSIIPRGKSYAVKKGWLDASEDFDFETVSTRLQQQVEEIAPSATFETARTEPRPPGATIANIIRRKASSLDAEIVFVGSKNAGKVITPVTSVSSSVTADARYAVYIARHRIGD